ncbi:MAG: hypothetical protein LBE70_05375 [Nitrososphaerota archaeon]|nr:hypothetical protein [Nitrososphaerota archaeon]
MDVERCEKKLSILLVEGSTTDRVTRNKHRRVVTDLNKLKRVNPQQYNTLLSLFVGVLGEIEKALKNGEN